MASSVSMPFLHMIMFVTLTATVCFLSVRLFKTVRDVEKLQRRIEVMNAPFSMEPPRPFAPPVPAPAIPVDVTEQQPQSQNEDVEQEQKKPIVVEVELPETLEPIAEETT